MGGLGTTPERFLSSDRADVVFFVGRRTAPVGCVMATQDSHISPIDVTSSGFWTEHFDPVPASSWDVGRISPPMHQFGLQKVHVLWYCRSQDFVWYPANYQLLLLHKDAAYPIEVLAPFLGVIELDNSPWLTSHCLPDLLFRIFWSSGLRLSLALHPGSNRCIGMENTAFPRLVGFPVDERCIC